MNRKHWTHDLGLEELKKAREVRELGGSLLQVDGVKVHTDAISFGHTHIEVPPLLVGLDEERNHTGQLWAGHTMTWQSSNKHG